MGRPWRKLRALGATGRGAAILALAFAALAAVAAGASAAPLVLVGNKTGDSVSAIDAQTHALVGGPIPLGSESGAIAIVPGGQAFVAEPAADAMAVIDPKTSKLVTTIPVGAEPIYLAVSPDGKTVYVADDGEAKISVIDTTTDTVTGSIPLAERPFSVTFAPNGAFAYAAVHRKLEVIDTATREVVGEPIEVGEGPLAIAFSPEGRTAFTANQGSHDISVVDTAEGRTVGTIEVPGSNLWGLAMSPDGGKLYAGDLNAGVRVISTLTRTQIGNPIPAGEEPFEIALTPDGRTLWVAARRSNEVVPIDTATETAGAPVSLPGAAPWQVAVTPDRSPTAAFAEPVATAAVPTTFSGAASTDPDGTVAGWAWSFGDGGLASGATVGHTYVTAGTFGARLSVVDNEGCGEATVLTGRTAYCSGNLGAAVTRPVTVAPKPVPLPAPSALCSRALRFGRIVHNRHNGTVRLRVRVPAAGSLYLFGKKVHAVTRRSVKGMTFLTLHARVEVNKRLKTVHHIPVRYRVTFYPAGSCAPITSHRSVALQRAPRKKKRHER